MLPRHLPSFALVCTSLALWMDLAAQQPRLVADINKQSSVLASSSPTGGATFRRPPGSHGRFANVGSWTYFRADGGTTVGSELYRTQGTAASTQLVKDIIPGGDGSFPNYLTAFKGNLVFGARDPKAGVELFVTDPTSNGTTVIDIYPGSTNGEPNSSAASRFCEYKGELYFVATDGKVGSELWKTDGTASGTKLVKDIWQGSGSSTPYGLKVFGSALFFAASDAQGRELWKTDGTAAGTVMVKDIRQGSGSSMDFKLETPWFEEMGGLLYFVADDGAVGQEIWATDGSTGGTKLVHDIYKGSSPSTAKHLTAIGKTLYFAASPDSKGNELHKSDGKTATVIKLGSLVAAYPYELTRVGTDLYFGAVGDRPGTSVFIGPQLWKYDGSKVSVFEFDSTFGSGQPTGIVAAQKEIYFAAKGSAGIELYRTDANAKGGARLIKDIWPGSSGGTPFDSKPTSITPRSDGKVLFAADDGKVGRELWVTDGSLNGTALVKDLNADQVTDASSPHELFHTAKRLFFAANDGSVGTELWTSDGTQTGTRLVADLYLGSNSLPKRFAVLGDKLFCLASDGKTGIEPYVLDLKTSKVIAIDVRKGILGSLATGFTAYRGAMYFAADGDLNGASAAGTELWRSDGTVQGTRMVADIYGGAASSQPSGFVVFRGELYFVATDSKTGQELWKTDGTASGTKLAVDVNKGASPSFPVFLSRVGEKLFFRATGDLNRPGLSGQELWVSDGTPTGTGAIDIAPGAASSSAHPRPGRPLPINGKTWFASIGDRVFFAANDGKTGVELWSSDGTATGTKMVDVQPGAGSSRPTQLCAVGSRIFFVADNGKDGPELHVSDGTSTGTSLVKAVVSGAQAGPEELTAVGERHVYFVAYSDRTGKELWRSDGTATGTRLVFDLDPTPFSLPGPSELTVMAGRLFFAGDDGIKGRELWSVDLDAHGDVRGRGCSSAANHPDLGASDPVLGGNMTFRASGAPTNSTGYLFVGLTAQPEQIFGDCVLFVDLSSPFVLVPVRPNAQGRVTLMIKLPNDNKLVGALVPVQAVFGPSSTGPFGLDFSNGIYVAPNTR